MLTGRLAVTNYIYIYNYLMSNHAQREKTHTAMISYRQQLEAEGLNFINGAIKIMNKMITLIGPIFGHGIVNSSGVEHAAFIKAIDPNWA